MAGDTGNLLTDFTLRIKSFSMFFRFCLQATMRRSGAPSQLSGNAMKKPRFLPPASSTFCPLAEPKPLSPKPALCSTLQKVKYWLYFTSYIYVYFFSLFYLWLILFVSSHSPKVQRTLAVPVVFNTDCEVRPKGVQAAPALSRALARVLNATESKENEREEEHSDTDVEDCTKGTKPSGKTQILLKLFVVAMARLWNKRNARLKTSVAHWHLTIRACEVLY